MKYLLFVWPDYEATGGMNDLSDTFTTLKAAKVTPNISENGEIWQVKNNTLRKVAEWDSEHGIWKDMK